MKKSFMRAIGTAAVCALLFSCGAVRENKGETEKEESVGTAACSEPEDASGTEFVLIRAFGKRRETLSRAVRLRDMTAEIRTGVAVRYADAGDDEAAEIAAEADRLSGFGEYSAAEGSFSRLCSPLLAKGALLPGESFGDALGEASLNETLKTKYGTFFLTGAIVPDSLSDVCCIAVNLETARRFSVQPPDPADVLSPAGWDALSASAATVPAGAGIYRYGTADRSVGTAVACSLGKTVTKEGSGGFPCVTGEDVRGAADAVRRAAAILGDGSVTFVPSDIMPQSERENSAAVTFSDPGILYLLCRTEELPALRGSGNEISVLPYPGGVSYADSTGGTAGVILNGEARPTGAFLRVLEDLSSEYVLPETVDACLSGRAYYDTQSRGALDVIFSSVRYEQALAVSGEIGEELSDAFTAAATGRGESSGWELKAAILSAEAEKILRAAGERDG